MSNPMLMVDLSKTKRRTRGKMNEKGSHSESATSKAVKPKDDVCEDNEYLTMWWSGPLVT